MAIELKGGLQPMTELRVYEYDMVAIRSQMTAKLAQAPGFFTGSPLLIDLESVADQAIDLFVLVSWLRSEGVVPVAVRGIKGELESQARDLNLAVLRTRRGAERPANTEVVPTEPPPSSPSRLVLQPVRSGQRIYARGGDLIVMAAVSTGAEVIADGHVHIYGPLRGRALAGAQGDVKARIMCQSLESELVAIAGCYKTAEDLGDGWKGRPAQIYLDGDSLVIQPL
jgi:septum site-determining protein MinC